MKSYSLRHPFARQVILLAFAILALSLTGGAAASLKVPASCNGWPVCLLSERFGWIQFVHNLAALVSAILLLQLFRRAWREYRRHIVILPLTTVLTTLFFGQIFT